MSDISKIIIDIKKGIIKPIYLLTGEEPYFIDKISDYIENNIISESERDFNQMVLYGGEISVDDIIDSAKRFPMMAEKQVVIIKEAQELWRNIDKLVDYAKNPLPSTVLVLCYKYKKLDKRKALSKAIQKNGVLFDSKKVYENKAPEWIRGVLQENNYTIDPKAALMLIEFLGTELGKLNNELEKLMLILPKGSKITPIDIEKNIGISKDYNNFELIRAIGNRDVKKSNEIINYFAHNQKTHNIISTIAILYNFFTHLMIYHTLNDKSRGNVAKVLKINIFFVSDYSDAAKFYKMRKISSIIEMIRKADAKSKGVGANSLPASDILKELIFNIIH